MLSIKVPRLNMFILQIVANGLKRSQTVANGRKWLQMLINGRKWLQTVANGLKRSQTVAKCRKWLQTGANGRKCCNCCKTLLLLGLLVTVVLVLVIQTHSKWDIKSFAGLFPHQSTSYFHTFIVWQVGMFL